jgi:hypothetical protein
MEETDIKNMNVEQLMVAIVNLSLEIKAVEGLLKENRGIPYDLEDVNAGGRTMGDLHKQRLAMQLELRERLISHKMKPYIGASREDLISKVAAAVLDSSDILEDRLRREFENKADEMVSRYRDLGIFFVKQKPRPLVLNRLREALQCYVHGFFQGCAILCRSTLETALRERIKKELDQEPRQGITLGPLLCFALKKRIISKDDHDRADKVKTSGDEAVHNHKRCSASEAFQSLNNTKLLLNIWYQ